jgi:signal transduction histidine kinase
MNKQTLPLLSMLVHEIKAPLAAVQQNLMAVRGGYAGEVPEQIKDILSRSENRISELIDFLERWQQFAQWTGGETAKEFQPLDPAEIINEILSIIKSDAEKKNVHLSVSIPEEPIGIIGDKKAFALALRNCLENAVKYSKSGGNIQIRLTAGGETANLIIVDDGIGIPKADQGRVFEPFFRASNAHEISGSGLGLAIARAIITGCGGNINIESEEGKGTSLQFILAVN